MNWFRQVFTGQIRLKLAYPWGFWSSFILELFVVTSINWFLWDAVLRSSGQSQIGGYGLRTLVLYAMITSILRKTQLSVEPWSGISDDIYTGSLNKYLVYPISYLSFRYAMQLGASLINLLQSSLALALFWGLWGLQDQPAPSLLGLFQFFVLCFWAVTLRFLVNALIQTFAFWVDQVWSLMVLVGFLIQILGGQLIPMALYPGWAVEILRLTPFPLFAAWPTEALLGRLSMNDFMQNLGVSLVWTLVFWLLFRLSFQRGVRNYSGVGA